MMTDMRPSSSMSGCDGLPWRHRKISQESRRSSGLQMMQKRSGQKAGVLISS